MLRTIRRLLLLSCCGLGSLAALAPASQAATSVTTLPANFVTTTSATLHGSMNTGGQATSWVFQYGPHAVTSATPVQTIPPGQPPINYEAATLFRLRPNTTYLFRLIAYSGIGTNYQEAQPGRFLTFTTKPTGRLRLMSSKLPVSGGRVHVPLKCVSRQACHGQFTIVARPSSGSGTRCAKKSFTIRPGKRHTFFPVVRAACRSLLKRHAGQRVRAHFISTTTTGQTGVNRRIKLIG